MKESYYFSHDYNAHKDPKCSALINDFGISGYGLYWGIIEILHEQGGELRKFPKLFDGLAYQLKIEKEYLIKILNAMIHDYELLKEDENNIWSDRVLRNINDMRHKYQLKAEAGRIGGINSGLSRNKTKQNEAVLEANEQKESKEKESKENITNTDLEEFVKYWNEIKITGSYKNTKVKQGVSVLPQCRKINSLIIETWNKLSRSYTLEEMKTSVQKYVTEICQRDPAQSYSDHRFALVEFLKRKGGLEKFITL